VAFAAEGGDLQVVAYAEGHLAVIHHLRGDRGEVSHYADAVRLYQEQLELGRRLSARPSEVIALVNLAQLHLRLGDPRRTVQLLEEAVRGDAEPRASTLVLCLQVEADRRLITGAVASGLALLGRIRTLPANEEADEVETQRILSRLQLPADELDRLLAAGVDLDLDEVVAQLRAG
jgi:hypothetical protein